MKYENSESVFEGHPDKLCDQISDAILDAYLTVDSKARVAVECCAHKDGILLMGEITSKEEIDLVPIVRQTIQNIGYDRNDLKFNGKTCEIVNKIHKQSEDIALGLENFGAGDQSIVYGYATKETKEYLPFSLVYAHKIAKKLTDLRKNKSLPYLRPDGKVLVSGVKENNDFMITSLVLAIQHEENVSKEKMEEDLKFYLYPDLPMKKETKIILNGTGKFVSGGPFSDSGLTGRKLMVDTYGSLSHHGGGAFSGKDPTKVDRSAAYYARYAAKNIVASGLCDELEIGLVYAIGKANPISITFDTFQTEKVSLESIQFVISNCFDFSLENIIKELDLQKPIYFQTSCFGHFGKENLPWEKLNKIDCIKKNMGM